MFTRPDSTSVPRRRAWLAPFALCAACSCGSEPDGPDVLLISLDSVRSDYLTFLDEETSPNLTELARRGTIFTQAVAGTSWTLPSHVQMFTGMPPVLHCVQEDDVRIDPLLPTLPRLLDGAGYECAGLYTCWYLAGEYGFRDGFASYRNSMRDGEKLEAIVTELLRGEGDLEARRAEYKRSMRSVNRFVTSLEVVENAAECIEAADPRAPFFLFAHLYDPHFDYVPPAPWSTRFDPEYDGGIDGIDYWKNKAVYDETKDPPRQISERDLEHVRALYRGEVGWTDSAIGSLLEQLEARGRLENTLIIVTADHGEEFFEHENRGHRRTLYEEVLAVPLLVVPPGTLAGEVSGSRDELVSLSDILPTILDYTGQPIPETVHGRSLRPLVEGGELAARPALSSLCVPLLDGERTVGRTLFEGLRTEDFKLVRGWVQLGDRSPELRTIEYFDLHADPEELEPLTTFEDRRVRAAWGALEVEMEAVRRAWGRRAKTPFDQLTTDFAKIVGDDLHDLGYAGGEDTTERGVGRRLGTVPLPPTPLRARDRAGSGD